MGKKVKKRIRTSSDIVVYILAALGPYARFSSKSSEIHSAFYVISQKNEFKSLFKDFIFCTDYHPWCETIGFALDVLGLSELLNNINLKLYEVTPALAAEDPVECFSKKEISLLKKAAAEFEKLVKVERIKICQCGKCQCGKPSLKIGLTD